MVSGKQILAEIQQDCMAACVAGHRDSHQVMIQFYRVITLENSFHAQSRRAVVSVHDALAAKSFSEARMIGDIITMSEKHCAHSAQGLDAIHQLRGESR